MTLDGWIERLRMIARTTVVELSPAEIGDLVQSIGPGGDASAGEREACAKLMEGRTDFSPVARAKLAAAIRARGRQ